MTQKAHYKAFPPRRTPTESVAEEKELTERVSENVPQNDSDRIKNVSHRPMDRWIVKGKNELAQALGVNKATIKKLIDEGCIDEATYHVSERIYLYDVEKVLELIKIR